MTDLLQEDAGSDGTSSPEPNATPRTGTDYVILSLDRPDEDFALTGTKWTVQLDSITASSADAAIRAYTDPNNQGGTFVAVPVRSFQKRTVVAETTTVMRFA